MSSSLGKTAAHGAIWSLGGQGIVTTIQYLSLFILARLLTPADYGLVAMVTVLVGLGEMFRDFGLTNATIQAPSLSPQESSNLFWVNTFIGGTLWGIFVLLANPIAQFYSQPELKAITIAIGSTFLLNGIATQPQALLLRRMRAKDVAVAEVISSAASFVVGVGAALLGFGYWSLVVMQVTRTLFRLLSTWTFSRFWPNRPNRDVSIRHFISFGINLTLAQLITYVSTNIDKILIGRSLGSDSLGIYTRGLQLGLAPLTQIVQPLNRVTIPLLSAVADDTERFNRTLLRIQRAFLLSTSFAFALVIVFADVIVRIVLGTGWEDVTLILQILCVVGLADSVMYLMYWVYVSRGLSSEYLQASLIYRSLLILALVWAVQYGMVATASTYATLHLFAWPFMIWWANRRAQLPVVQFSWMTIRSFVLNGTLVAAGFGVRLLTDDHGLLISVPATLLAWLAVVLLFWLGIPAFREDTRSIIDSMKLVTSGMLPRRFTRNP